MPQTKEEVDKFAKGLHLSLLREGKSIYVNAWGGSMYPFVKSGDRIRIVPIDKRKIKIGDIIIVNMRAQKGPWFFAHRVVKIVEYDGKTIYFTKGDFHKKGLDAPVPEKLIVGKITQIIRRGVEIDLEHPLWRYFNSVIAKVSLSYPRILPSLSRYINLIIEWKRLPFKVKNRLKKGNPLRYNADELFLICARKELNGKLTKQAIELIKEGIHWENFAESTMKNGVTILVYNGLLQISPYVHIPQSASDTLKNTSFFILSKTLTHHREILKLLKIFALREIPIIPLKGTLLSKRLYQDIAARGVSVDFDLLIEEKNKEECCALLKNEGYSLSIDGKGEHRWWQYSFVKPKAQLVDLHCDITPMVRSPQRIEGIWKGSRLVEEEGICFYELEEEELLLYLSAHFVNSSRFRQLRYVCDINELLYKYKEKLDWGSMVEKAKEWKLSNSLYVALKLSKDLFDSDFPLEALKKLKPNVLKQILIKLFVNKKVYLRNCLRRRLINTFQRYILFFELIELGSIVEYVSILKRVFFPPKEVMGGRNYIIRILKGIAWQASSILRK